MLLYRKITDNAKALQNKAAIIFEGKEVSYAKFNRDVDGIIKYLSDRNVRYGNRVAWLGFNHYIAVEIFFACAAIGAVFVPINWRLSADEIDGILEDCNPSLIVFQDKGFQEGLTYKYKDMVSLSTLIEKASDGYLNKISYDCGPAEDSIVLISYTSGSTGKPKGVMINQLAVYCNYQMSVEAHSLTENDSLLNVLPIFHVGGLNILVTAGLLVGATVFLHQKYELKKVISDLPAVNCVILVPAILNELLRDEEFVKSDFPKLRTISIGSTIVPLEMIEKTQALGINIIQLYGSTEVTPFAIHQREADSKNIFGSIGKSGSSCQIKLIDPSGNEVEQGKVGEICVRGDSLFSRYTGKNDGGFYSGWFRTGDLARKDSLENYWFVDRIKNVIISGGENIYPAELENLFVSKFKYNVVAAVAKVDKTWGEVPILFVEGSNDADCDFLTADIWQRIAKYKRPRNVIFLSKFPRNAMGKIDLVKLRKIANAS